MAKLTQPQRDALDKYLQEKQKLIKDTPSLTTTDLAEWCRDNLKFSVDIGNITRRVGPNGLLYNHIWPGTEAVQKGRRNDGLRVNLVIEQIELLRKDLLRLGLSLGESTFGRKTPDWDGVLDSAQNALADTDRREPEEK